MSKKTVDGRKSAGIMADMSTVQLSNLVSVSEAAERLRVSVQRVHAIIGEGRLRAQQKGRMWLIDEESLEDFASKPRSVGNPNFSRKSS